MSSLYERLGGEVAINATVALFYKKVLNDARIKHFFDGMDMDRMRRKQKAFLTVAFGGPNQPTERGLRAAHAKIPLKEEHFNAVIEHLGTALRELKVAEPLIAEAATIALSVKKDVLNR